MKILVVGSGGREDATVLKLAESPEVEEIICAPGSHAIGLRRIISNGRPVRVISGIQPTDAKIMADYAKEARMDLVVPGHESCLEADLGDWCRAYGIPFAGPCSRGARLETSKAFQFQFLMDNGIPSPLGKICETVTSAKAFANMHWNGVVVKADGMARGKGVKLCENTEEAYAAIEKLMIHRECGRAATDLSCKSFFGKELISARHH